MNVLVINAGSSSLKYQLLNPDTQEILAKGLCERIGIDGKFTYKPTGKTAVLDCRLGAHIAPEGFSGWNDRTDTCLARFAEAGSSGPGACQRPDWVAAPSAADAAALLARARKLCRP